MKESQYTLSRYRSGSISETLILFTPLLFSIFSGSMMSFCDRLFASHYSLGSLKAITVANYFCIFFQLIICRAVAISQVFIGKSFGEKKFELIGPYCWQMIWISILSTLITLPLGFGLSDSLFSGSEIASEGSLYYKIMICGNFLFPLGTTFSSYFTGLGKTKIVGICFFGAQFVNIGLNYLLIFGISHWVPALGIKGAALGTLFAQGLLCFVFFILFLREDRKFMTRKWFLNKTLLKEELFLGIPRSAAKLVSLLSWNMVVCLILGLEKNYLLVLSVGSSIWLIYLPVVQSLGEVVTTQISFYRGKKEPYLIWKSIKSSINFLAIFSCILGLCFLCFFDSFLSFFLAETISSEAYGFLKLAGLWLWIFSFIEGINLIGLGIVTGLGKTWFAFKMNIYASFPLGYLPFLLAFKFFHLDPDKIWMVCWFIMMIVTPFYFIKAKQVIQKIDHLSTKQASN